MSGTTRWFPPHRPLNCVGTTPTGTGGSLMTRLVPPPAPYSQSPGGVGVQTLFVSVLLSVPQYVSKLYPWELFVARLVPPTAVTLALEAGQLGVACPRTMESSPSSPEEKKNPIASGIPAM